METAKTKSFVDDLAQYWTPDKATLEHAYLYVRLCLVVLLPFRFICGSRRIVPGAVAATHPFPQSHGQGRFNLLLYNRSERDLLLFSVVSENFVSSDES
jgi:hypothetical protein